MKYHLIFLYVVCFTSYIFSQTVHADMILGKYKATGTKKDTYSIIEIRKDEFGKYCGFVVYADPSTDSKGNPIYDVNNPEPSKRKIRIDKIQVLSNFTFSSKHNEWSGGRVYNPEDGEYYKTIIKFDNSNTLKLRGYIGIPLFGKTVYWPKIK